MKLLLLILGAWFVLTAALTPLYAKDSGTCTLKVVAHEYRNLKGKICVAVYDKEDGWLDGGKYVVHSKCVSPQKKETTIAFDNVKHGQYGVSLFHDEDENGELETNWIGMPKEGIGISNNARGSFGPPSFKDAAFAVNKDCAVQRIKLSYL